MKNSSIAITSGKGGTGKSMISAALGGWLANIGFKVLLVDLDLTTCGLTLFLLSHANDNKYNVEFNLNDYLFNNMNLPEIGKYERINFHKMLTDVDTKTDRTLAKTHEGELYLLKSVELASSMEKMEEKPLMDVDKLMDKLSLLFEYCSSDGDRLVANDTTGSPFDYIIFDTRGGTDATSLAAVLLAQAYIAVTEMDIPSTYMGTGLTNYFQSGRKKYNERNNRNINVRRLGFVINKNVFSEDLTKRECFGLENTVFQSDLLAQIELKRVFLESFQYGRIPFDVSKFCGFSFQVLKIIDEIYYEDSDWNDEKELHTKTYNKLNHWFIQQEKKTEWKMYMIAGMFGVLFFASVMIHVLDTFVGFTYDWFGFHVPFWLTLIMILGIVSITATIVKMKDYYDVNKTVDEMSQERKSRLKISENTYKSIFS